MTRRSWSTGQELQGAVDGRGLRVGDDAHFAAAASAAQVGARPPAADAPPLNHRQPRRRRPSKLAYARHLNASPSPLVRRLCALSSSSAYRQRQGLFALAAPHAAPRRAPRALHPHRGERRGRRRAAAGQDARMVSAVVPLSSCLTSNTAKAAKHPPHFLRHAHKTPTKTPQAPGHVPRRRHDHRRRRLCLDGRRRGEPGGARGRHLLRRRRRLVAAVGVGVC